jgi:tetratricopeptide (TPR) repeat protein
VAVPLMTDDLSLLVWFVTWQIYRLAVLLKRRYPSYSIALCNVVVKWNAESPSVLKQRLHARALLTTGLLNSEQDDREGSVAINRSIVNTYRRSNDREIRTYVAWAMTNGGLDLTELGRAEQAIEVFEQLVTLIPPEDPYLQPLAQGLNNWASALGDLGRHDEAIAIEDRVATILAERADEPNLGYLYAWALVAKGETLAFQRDFAGAINAFDDVLHRWWSSQVRGPSDRLQEALAAALRHRSASLVALHEYDSAIADVNRAMDRFAGSRTVGIQEEVAWAMLGKAIALEQIGRRAEALSTCDLVVKQYGHSTSAQVSEPLSRARKFRQTLIGA